MCADVLKCHADDCISACYDEQSRPAGVLIMVLQTVKTSIMYGSSSLIFSRKIISLFSLFVFVLNFQRGRI